MSQTRLFLDAGNSSLHWAVRDDDREEGWTADGRVAMRSPEEAVQRVARALEDKGIGSDPAAEVVVVTSRPDVETWERVASERLGRSLALLGRDFCAEIRTEYYNPEQLGQDRVANILAARWGELYPCLILDAGTCMTADVLDLDGVHVGGAIAAGGPALWAGVLDRAPHLEAALAGWPDPASLGAWGRSTEENLALGWEAGLVGVALGLVARYAEMTDCEGKVILTGGDAERLAAGMGEMVIVRPLLTLEGLRLAWESCCSA
jgi:type III pantothenate kinase